MSGTSIHSPERKEYIDEYVTTETVITSEKAEDYLHDTKRDFEDVEKSSLEHNEDEEDSPVEVVRAVVPK